LRQIAETQERRNDGLMQPFGPGGIYGSPIQPAMKVIPAFCLIWVLSLKDYYLFTADTQALKRLYPYLVRLMAGFQNFLTDRNLLYFDSQKYWNFIDWAPLDYEGETAALNCYYVGALRTAAELAESVGDLKNKADYIGQAEKVKSALNQYLWNKEVSLYADSIKGDKLSEVYSQHSNCLAVLFGIAEDEDAVLNNILTKKGLMPVASPYFMCYFLEALFKKNQHQKAYDIIRTRWGEMVSRGATTFWEVFEEVTRSDQGGSLCHAWSSAPTYHLISEYLAVKPIEPGFKKVLIAPKPVGLSRLEGAVPTPYGKIKVSWQTEPKFTISVDLPKGTSGTLVLPDQKPISFTGRF